MIHKVTLGWLGVLASLALAACADGPQPDLRGPQSVLYDALRDEYVVSNSQGSSLSEDDDGFILRVSPENGNRTAWISADQPGVTLNAPKGMAFVGDELWVADINTLRRFDRTSGEPLGDVPIIGASNLHDVSVAPDGSVYCSDSGLNELLEPTGSDAIYRVTPDLKVAVFAQGVDLGQPKGIWARTSGVYVVSWRDGTFFQLDYRGNRTDLSKTKEGQLDGLVRVAPVSLGSGGGEKPKPAWFATSWAKGQVYRFGLLGGAVALPLELDQAADLGYDPKRHCLMIPVIGENRLHIERL